MVDFQNFVDIIMRYNDQKNQRHGSKYDIFHGNIMGLSGYVEMVVPPTWQSEQGNKSTSGFRGDGVFSTSCPCPCEIGQSPKHKRIYSVYINN